MTEPRRSTRSTRSTRSPTRSTRTTRSTRPLKTKPKKRRILIPVAVLVLGLILVGYQPVLNHIVGPKVIVKAQENNLTQEVISDNIERASQEEHTPEELEEIFDYDSVTHLDTLPVSTKIDSSKVIGGVYAPDAGLFMPIMYGVSQSVLLNAAGTMKPNQSMGVENYALIGHNSKNPNVLFAPVHRMNIGDAVYLSDKQTLYKYVIDVKQVVEPSDIHVIDDIGEPLITLLTCTHDSRNRLLVQGNLIEIIDYVDAPDEIIKIFNRL